MKLLVPPKRIYSSAALQQLTLVGSVRSLLGLQIRDKDVASTNTITGRSSILPIFIEADDLVLGQRIDEVTLDGYRIFGLLPVQRRGNEFECVCDHFELET